jgi:crotonobetainyl-CoA:carnitine CoA-transferase CaiB-like acyl-CoA transferase
MTLPLADYTVLDLTRARSGPTCVRQLADMGANVIQIESIEDPDQDFPRHGSDFQNIHRNKRSITLNLKDKRGVAILKELAARADVVVENFRPNVKHRLGIDYETLAKINPRLVYGSISGFGQEGPYRDHPGYDQVAQGLGGLMSITGTPGQGPMRVGVPIGDLTAGLFLAQGILVALLEREKSGKGQWVSTSLLQAVIGMLDFQAARWLMNGEVPGQAGNNHPTVSPTGVFRTKDGQINIAASGQTMFRRLCETLGLPALVDDARFKTPGDRSKNRDQLNAILEQRLSQYTQDEIVQRLNQAGVPAGPILDIGQVFQNEQVKGLGLSARVQSPELGEIEIQNTPYRLSRTPGGARSAAPERGEHTNEVLAELGHSANDIRAFRAAGVV